ncbi:FHA domain-containing protein [Psychrobacter sp. FDAARGOS_221]|uniref:FHA domain-containing protein n=1 Tax=Psychrobacter sp. FDAARGOS_221 TaxID=1975705 RepID=UPI000BB53DA8|nr:FHA domain-containing protein [Psychrobacter sp. FDAARGOS_221]PNK61115.1 hypothetical protein A6J60_009665 [Psychrobacter sp. FDAARGOS_221]
MTTSANKSWTLTAISDSLGDLEAKFDDQLSVGRRYDNDVVISSNQVALQHAKLSVENDQLMVTDLGTVHGTFINNKKVTPNEPHPVNSDDVLSFGTLRVLVHLDNDAQATEELVAASEQADVEDTNGRQATDTAETSSPAAPLASIATVAAAAAADAKPWQFTAISDSLGDISFGTADQLTVGRADDNDVVIDSDQVADHHAKLSVEGNQLYVTDLGSSTGTSVHSVKAPANEPVLVNSDDVISFGSLRVLAAQHEGSTQQVAAQLVPAATETATTEDTDVANSTTGTSKWQLSALTDVLGDLTIPVTQTLSVGRGTDNDVVLGSKEVSRNHAKLDVLDDGSLTVTDLGSSNGTFVNEKQLAANQAESLSVEDVVQFASFEFTVLPAADSAADAPVVASEADEGSTTTTETIAPNVADEASAEQEVVEQQAVDTQPVASDVDAQPKHDTAETKTETVEQISEERLEEALEAELEEPIPVGDPNQSSVPPATEQPVVDNTAQQIADTQSSEQQQPEHKEALVEDADPEVEKAREAATGQLSGIENSHPKAENPISEPKPHPVAHANSQTPANNTNPKGNSMALWIVLILVGLAVALWLYNSN